MLNYKKKISIIIPCYNEKKTITSIISKIHKQSLPNKEIILVDDCSSDGTKKIIKNFKSSFVDKVIFHRKNMGKGACIKTAKKYIDGQIVIIQDADLEYDPRDYKKLIFPILRNRYKVVYGSRVLGKNRYDLKNFSSIYRIFFNHVLTIFSNLINKQKLTDAHTCYKVFSRDIFDKINLEENGFSFCPEVTTKISNLGVNILELPITYNGRTFEEGKKIKFKDGFQAIYALLKYKILNK